MERTEMERIVTNAVLRVMQIIHDTSAAEFASKGQVTKQDIIRHFDRATFIFLTSRLGLRPVRQNGKAGKIYYSTKKVLDLTSKWYHI